MCVLNCLHSVTLDEDLCRGCTNCIANCPTEAIRVRNGKAYIISERCIDCGECIRSCPSHAKKAISDPVDIINNGEVTSTVSFTLPDGQQQSITLHLGTAGKYDGITQFAAPTTTKAVDQDGYEMGYLETFIIDNKGVITGIYSNGEKIPLGQVALATFVNPEGLEKTGDNNYVQTNNSGLANIGAAGTAGKGSLQSGALEMSNVDLSEEFTSMIITQRGFEANSKTITTSDQMLQVIMGLKR